MPNLDLERRSNRRQAITTFTLPPMPQHPEWMRRKFNELIEFDEALERWRQQAQTNIIQALQSAKAD